MSNIGLHFHRCRKDESIHKLERSELDVWYTARLDGQISVRTRLCMACGLHFVTSIYVSPGKMEDYIKSMTIIGYPMTMHVSELMECIKFPWSSGSALSAEEFHNQIVESLDQAMLERLEQELRQWDSTKITS